jgi:hypothetical protein
MSISKEEAIRYASEKLDIIPKDFCWIGDFCAHFSHKIDNPKDIQFHGYCVIEDVQWESNVNPIWKRIDVYIKSFSFFPPLIIKPISMQIHHLVQGWYEDVDRTRKIYIVSVDKIKDIIEQEKTLEEDELKKLYGSKIFKFRPKQNN